MKLWIVRIQLDSWIFLNNVFRKITNLKRALLIMDLSSLSNYRRQTFAKWINSPCGSLVSLLSRTETLGGRYKALKRKIWTIEHICIKGKQISSKKCTLQEMILEVQDHQAFQPANQVTGGAPVMKKTVLRGNNENLNLKLWMQTLPTSSGTSVFLSVSLTM